MDVLSNKKMDNLHFPSELVKIQVNHDGKAYFITIPQNEVFRIKEIFQDHEYSLPANHQCQHPMTIIDIGANVGVFAIYAKLLGENNIVHCFEPTPASIELLQQNLKTMAGTYVYPFGLSNQDGEALLHINNNNSGQNSIKFGIDDFETVKINLHDAATILDELALNHIDILKLIQKDAKLKS